tara:strand:+ start:3905 stop:5500 length:1596 start_codon:yes stop_codon:yes gene_type:complete
MALNFDLNSVNFGAPPSDVGGNELLGGLGLGGAAFAAQTGRPPTPVPSGKLSPFAQRVAANDAARRAAARTAARAAAGSSLGPATLAFTGGYAFGTALDQAFDGAISDKVASGISNLLGLSIDQPAAFNAPTLNDLAAINVDKASIGAEEARNLNKDEVNNQDPDEPTRQEYCEARYYPGISPEQCNILEEQENLVEEQSRGFVPTMDDLQQSGAEASFVLPSGEVRTIMPGQDVASVFGRERGTRTFPVDQGSVTVPSNLLAQTMGLTPSLQDIQNVQPPRVATDDTFVPDGRSSYFTESVAREQRIRDRDRRPGETQTERDTRLARSKTLEGRARAEARGSGVGRDMTFEEARKFISRQENYRGEKESVATYNQRIREFKERYNSDPQKAAREANRLANEGKRLNNKKAQAELNDYKKTSAQKYQDVVTVADLLVEDGLLTEDQKVFFIVDQMGGDIKKLFAEPSTPSGGSDGKIETPTLVGQLTGQTGVVDVSRIPQQAKQVLINDPDLRDFFDQKYGKGSAQAVLGE